MLSDEEKKAIDDLFALTHINGYIDLYTQREVKIHTLDLSKWQNGVKVLLNLIEKQSKEIEELKDNYSEEKIRNTIIKRYREVIEKDYVSKDKIKAKIEEVSNGTYDAKIVLETLLEKE